MPNILCNFEELLPLKEALITIGNFDGFHLGHQNIIKKMSVSRNSDRPLILISFSRSPLEILCPAKFEGYLFPENKKKDILLNTEADYLICLDFNRVKDTGPEDFINQILSRIQKPHFFAGLDFKYGSGGLGNIESLKKLEDQGIIELSVIQPFLVDETTVSSSRIRHLIKNGHIGEANRLLGRPYWIHSNIISGDSIGQSLGFPTINLQINKQVLPADGVYLCAVYLKNQWFPAMSYTGYRPTVNGHDLRLETHIIMEPDIPEIPKKELSLIFLRKTRGEKKFNSLEELRETLYNDRIFILNLWKENDHFTKDLKKINIIEKYFKENNL